MGWRVLRSSFHKKTKRCQERESEPSIPKKSVGRERGAKIFMTRGLSFKNRRQERGSFNNRTLTDFVQKGEGGELII